MHHEQRPASSIRRHTRLIKYPYPSTLRNASANDQNGTDVAQRPTTRMNSVHKASLPPTPPVFNNMTNTGADPDDISIQSTLHLMQLSGMMRAVRVPMPPPEGHQPPSLPEHSNAGIIEEYWPYGIQQTGPL